MLAPPNTNVIAAFMMEGLRDLDRSSPGNPGSTYCKILEAWGNGCLELVTDMVQYAPYIDAKFEVACARGGDFPGVFDYEVSSPFGSWYGTRILKSGDELDSGKLRGFPTEVECKAAIDLLVREFFN